MSSLHTKLDQERKLGRAVVRFARLVNLVALNAPAEIVENEEALFDRSLEEIGGDITVVLKAYPAYAIAKRGAEARDQAWEDRCTKCVNWRGMFGLVDPDSEVGGSKPWCAEYDFDGMTQPAPCPKFRGCLRCLGKPPRHPIRFRSSRSDRSTILEKMVGDRETRAAAEGSPSRFRVRPLELPDHP